MLLSASMQFVVRKLRFRAGSIPSLWSVRVSSRPACSRQALFQAGQSRRVHQPEFGFKGVQCGLCSFVGVAVIGLLKLATDPWTL